MSFVTNFPNGPAYADWLDEQRRSRGGAPLTTEERERTITYFNEEVVRKSRENSTCG